MDRLFITPLLVFFASTALAALDVAGIDKSKDACADFYGYANARWMQSVTIPADRPRWGTFDEVALRNERLLKAALEDAMARTPPEGSPERKAVQYYASALDTAAIEKAGLAPLAPLFDRIAALRASDDLPKTVAQLHAFSIEAPFRFSVSTDDKDSSRYLAQVYQSGLGLPDRDDYFRDDAKTKALREAYRRHVAKMLELAGDSPEVAARESETVWSIESELAKNSLTAVERRDVDRNYNPRTVAQLASEAPGFDWAQYFEATGARALDALNVAQPGFMKAFARMAKERPVAEWQAYLRWHVLRAAGPRLPDAFERESFAFDETVVRGVKERPERWRQALMTIGGRYGQEPMAQALGKIFVERAFPPEAKARALKLVGFVKEALADRLATLEWMSDDTRTRALEKLRVMNVKVGYPDRWRDFTDADVGPYSYVRNWLNAGAFEHRRQLAHLGKPVDRSEWFMSPQIVNASYNARFNEITFPAGILQPPFFDAAADDAINYGGIGAVIGHEITHGFDDRGRRYDAKGNLRDWWTAQDARRYVERASRIEHQYDDFVGVDAIHVNGKLTLGENISDIGGLKIAYLALHKALAQKPQPEIDGLTPDQRFFLSFAEIWRAKSRDEYERLGLRTDGHSPPRFRVAGTLAHLPEFARAFHCGATRTALGADRGVEIW
ncbi:MAG: M13 family metallopeptidase [Bacillota bacterium]